MVIVRDFDPNGWILPMLIKADGKVVDKLSFFRSQSVIKEPVKELSLKSGFWHSTTKVAVKECNQVLIIKPPFIVVFLFALSVLSLFLNLIVGNTNDFIFYGTLIVPCSYLLVILYYFLFRKGSYYNILSV